MQHPSIIDDAVMMNLSYLNFGIFGERDKIQKKFKQFTPRKINNTTIINNSIYNLSLLLFKALNLLTYLFKITLMLKQKMNFGF